jgi:transcriptional regulator with XRE-family HTH domain
LDTRAELGRFLRAARARTAPQLVDGLSDRGAGNAARPRRVKGLRREEVAQLAGVSFDYYARLEQGRVGNVSEEVLTAVGAALRLDETEQRYLRRLLDAPRRTPPATGPRQRERVRPSVRRLVDTFGDVPVMITGQGMDVLAVNALAAEIFFDPAAVPAKERNLARWTFLDPAARQRYADWERIAQGMAHGLRLRAADPADARSGEVVAELVAESADFRRMWADQGAFECTFASKTMRHPLVGELRLDCEALPVPGEAVQRMNVHSAPAGSIDEARLQALRDHLRTEARD